MSVWKTEKHDIAFSIYKPFDVRSYLDKQGGCVFCNKSRLLRAMCIISTSVNNMTVLQSNETSHEIDLSIKRCRLMLCKIIANNVFVNHQIKFVEGNISLSSWSVLISKVLV